MTEDSVRAGSICKDEWVWGLKYKKPIIPLRLHAQTELPFRLSSRQFLDISTDFEAGLARLRNHLRWCSTPAGVLAELQQRLADAERELPRTEVERQRLVEAEIAELRERIDKQQRLIDDPAAEQHQTRQRIEAGMERERQPERPAVPEPTRARFVNPPPMTAPGHFQDRHAETGLVGDYLRSDGCRMVTVVGRGGVGKTAMVCRLLKALETGHLPDDGGELVVSGIVYLGPVGGHAVTFANLFHDLARLLPEDNADVLRQRYRDPHQTPTELMHALLEHFSGGRTVVLLDNFEDLVDPDTFAVADPALDEALRALLNGPDHGVTAVLTTRVAPRDLLLLAPAQQRRLNLDEGLPSPYAENILRAMDPDGSLGLKTAPDALLDEARERTRGYPRALEALVAILAADRDTTLPELLEETAVLPENVVQALVGEAFNRLDPLAQQVMQALAIYAAPVAAVAVDYLLQPYRAAVDAAPVLSRLVNMQFVRRDAGRYYLHQVDRDYALSRIPAGVPDDDDVDPPTFTQQALRHRGADYFEQIRTPRETWKTLDDLAPQLAEYELRRQTGDYDTAAKVLLEIDVNYLILWGHYRETVRLHERLQGFLTDPWIQVATLSSLGSCYYMQDDYPRATDHNLRGLVMARDTGNRWGEAQTTLGLANCYFMQADYPLAIDNYQDALDISRELGDRGGDAMRGLAACHYMQGDYSRAIDHYQAGLDIARDTGNRAGESDAMRGLASCFFMQGDYSRAIDHFRVALDLSREIGDRFGEGDAMRGLAGCYLAQGDYSFAIDHFREALDLSREIGDRFGESGALNGLAGCYLGRGDYSFAIDHYEAGLDIARDIGDRSAEGGSVCGLAACYQSQGDSPRAIDHFQQALDIARDIGNRSTEGSALNGLAGCYQEQGDNSGADEYYQQALDIARDIGDRSAEADALSGLSTVGVEREDWPVAVRYGRQAVEITDTIESLPARIEARLVLATTHLLTGDFEQAKVVAGAAFGSGDEPSRAYVSLVLAISRQRLGNFEAARIAFRDAASAADELLARTPDNFGALDTRALALCGLTVVDEPSHETAAVAAFQRARAITDAPGVVRRVVRLLDALTAGDAGVLVPQRRAAIGD